ncbi:MAG: hypothetical protein KDC44_04025 [Phaeodactylibacter sp.]|nr:hypothetical protein [Phaeodactylibacter sp.]
MTKRHLYWAIFTLLVAFAACRTDSGKRSIANYYFPYDPNAEGVVYEYTSALDELDPPFYWYTRPLKTDSADFLVRAYYDHQFQPYQLLREELVSNGVLLADYRLYDWDSTGQNVTELPVQIEGNNLFPFELSDESGVLFFKISFLTEDSILTTLIRNRQYLGDTTWTYKGKTYDCVRFYVRELVDIETEGHAEHEFDGEEIYADGLGLVYFEKNISDQFRTAYALADTFSMQELERRFSEAQMNGTLKTIIPQE